MPSSIALHGYEILSMLGNATVEMFIMLTLWHLWKMSGYLDVYLQVLFYMMGQKHV